MPVGDDIPCGVNFTLRAIDSCKPDPLPRQGGPGGPDDQGGPRQQSGPREQGGPRGQDGLGGQGRGVPGPGAGKSFWLTWHKCQPMLT